jgi:hypothetical protein
MIGCVRRAEMRGIPTVEDQPDRDPVRYVEQERSAPPAEVSLMDCVARAYKPVPELRPFLQVAGDEAGLRNALTRIEVAGGIASESPLDFALAFVWRHSRVDDEALANARPHIDSRRGASRRILLLHQAPSVSLAPVGSCGTQVNAIARGRDLFVYEEK